MIMNYTRINLKEWSRGDPVSYTHLGLLMKGIEVKP